MSGSVDWKKWAAWRQRLERFGRSGLPVTRFCAAEGVSLASFYLWRKKLAAEKREAQPRPPAGDARFSMPAMKNASVALRLAPFNSDNPVIRRNRLNLLHRIRAVCSGVADLSRIEG